MALRPLVVATTFGLLATACGGSADTPSASASASTAPEVRAFRSLCSVGADVAADDLAGAEATFQDEVHETLHELADQLASTDRVVSAALLEAKSEVEADFLEGSPDPARLGLDVQGLVTAMADALDAAGFPALTCPELAP